MALPVSRSSLNLSCSMEVKPHLDETATFWRPGNLNLARRSASTAVSFRRTRVRMDLREEYKRETTLANAHSTAAYITIWPMATRANKPLGLPKAPRIPVCRRSAPAHVNILLMRRTW